MLFGPGISPRQDPASGVPRTARERRHGLASVLLLSGAGDADQSHSRGTSINLNRISFSIQAAHFPLICRYNHRTVLIL